jgi:hypothetical protein
VVCSKIAVKITTGHIKFVFGNSLMQMIDTSPQSQFDAPRVKCCREHHDNVS